MEVDSITSLFIVYRYDSTTEAFTVPPGRGGFYYISVYYLQIQILLRLCLLEMACITSLFIVYRYDSTTATFMVPPGGD